MSAVAYTLAWITACTLALGAIVARPDIELRQAEYWRFLAQPWKVGTFCVAWLALVLLAPMAGDPTWDRVDVTFMGVLTFMTAPWAVGTIAKGLVGQRTAAAVLVAACCWMFSASWSYDLYLWGRDGSYPSSWLTNLLASGCLYLYAGLLWNLSWRGSWMPFAFQDTAWPQASAGDDFRRVAPFALGVIAPVAVVIIFFVM